MSLQQPGSWMLLLGNALLDEVEVHVRRPGDPWQLLGRSGEEIPRHAWPVDYRSPAFQFEPAAAGSYELLVRLRARNALVTRIDLWQRLAFDNHTRREALSFGLYFGLYLLLIGVQLVFWLGTRAPVSGLFLAYLSVCVLNEVVSLGLVQQLTGLPGFWSDRLLGCGIAGALAISMQLACRQLELASLYPRLVRQIVPLLWLFSLCCMLLVVSGHYSAGMVPVQAMTLPLTVGFLAFALWLWRRGHAPARFFMLAFGIFYAGVLISFLRNLGWLPMNALTALVSTHASALGTMAHMLLLSGWIIGGYERRRRIREREQVRLEAELRQRQLRESELSEALALERRVRQEQRDFVAMVSHELRTPLAIILTSAQQLARNLAVEWGPKGIRTCAIVPGPFPTEGAWSRLMPKERGGQDEMIKAIPMRRTGEHIELANLAAFLYWMKLTHPTEYRHVVEHVQLVAPFFDDFILEPSRTNPNKIKLEWKQKGSDAYFDGFSLSDGTLRFICLAVLLLRPEGLFTRKTRKA